VNKKKGAGTCITDNLTDLRRSQSPDRDTVMMFVSENCWPFTCRMSFKDMGGGLYGRILWHG
jgi:hypothetical protein